MCGNETWIRVKEETRSWTKQIFLLKLAVIYKHENKSTVG